VCSDGVQAGGDIEQSINDLGLDNFLNQKKHPRAIPVIFLSEHGSGSLVSPRTIVASQ